ncbi:MAG: PEP-CTERM sorting domain-containing protein [Acidobacteria bacterium]|nr:PEP-CTERM sorting domain-containing protein [Acidobacteriota bacterium]
MKTSRNETVQIEQPNKVERSNIVKNNMSRLGILQELSGLGKECSMFGRIGKLGGLLFVVLVTAVCMPAQAVTIANGATTVFYDGFEAYPAGSPPPSPWVTGGTTVTVRDSAVLPGPFEGLNYLKLNVSGASPFAEVPFASQTSGTVKLTFMANTGSEGDFGVFQLQDTGSGASFQINVIGHLSPTFGIGPAVIASTGSGAQFLALGWSDNVWKKVELEYTMGALTATLTIDGVAVAGVRSTTDAAISNFDQLWFGVTSTFATEFNVDAVVIPEPATMGLLAVGGLLMLGRRRRA